MTNNVIPFKEPDPKCSFCGTTKSQSRKFIEGPNGKNICGNCLKHAMKRLKDTEMKHSDGGREAGKGDAPRKQQDQKAYEEGWDRIFAKKPKRNVYDEIVEGFESMKTQKQEDDCND